jgi:hypothetical protein
MNDNPEEPTKKRLPIEGEHGEKFQESDDELKTPAGCHPQNERHSKRNSQDNDIGLENRVKKYGKGGSSGSKNKDPDTRRLDLAGIQKSAITLAKFIMWLIAAWPICVMVILILSRIRWKWFHILHVSDNVMVALIQSIWCSSAFGLLGLIIERFLPKWTEKS